MLLVVLSALGGVLLFTSNDDRADVLVAAAELQPGRPVERGDLRIGRVAAGDDVQSMPFVEAADVIGRYPVGRIPAGTMLSPGMFAADVPLGADEVVFGAALDPGEAPLSGLEIGAPVELLAVEAPDRRRSAGGAGDAGGDGHRVGGRADRHRTAVGLDAGATQRRLRGLARRRVGHVARRAGRWRRMTLVTVCSVSGSPGATSVAIGLAATWPEPERRRVVVEADPDGGRLGAELGTGVEPGLMALALAARTTALTADELVDEVPRPSATGRWCPRRPRRSRRTRRSSMPPARSPP